MNARHLAILLACLTTVSCEKVKSLVAKASAAVKEQVATKKTGSTGGSSGKIDEDLRKLVDQTADGAVFRKDLPFPTRLEVRTTTRQEVSSRVVESSAIEKRRATVKGTRLTITKLELTDNQVRYTTEKSSFILPAVENPAGKKDKANEPVEQLAPAVPPITFRKTGKSWQAENHNDLRAAVLAKQLTPVFGRLLVENALAPRPMWFAKHRFKVGDRLEVTGETLPILLEGAAKGSFTLKLESFEPVDGHPCGVFSVTGDYSRTQVPDFDGNTNDEKVSIQSGKIWFSLIYPVILKSELDTIQSAKSGGQGGQVMRGQGAFKVSETRTWKRLP